MTSVLHGNKKTEKVEAKVRLALMKNLAGMIWCADIVTLRRLYADRVKSVLENGMTAWGTTVKSCFDQVSKIQK